MTWDEIEPLFAKMGFTRTFPSTSLPGEIVDALKHDLAA
jgi:hypothetical protein